MKGEDAIITQKREVYDALLHTLGREHAGTVKAKYALARAILDHGSESSEAMLLMPPVFLQEERALTDEDFVLGIRPEAIDIVHTGRLAGEIYGAMPTGMESTVKVRVGDFLLTGVVFGSELFTLGARVQVDVTGENVMLFDRRSGVRIAVGALEL